MRNDINLVLLDTIAPRGPHAPHARRRLYDDVLRLEAGDPGVAIALTDADYRRLARGIYEINDMVSGAQTFVPLAAEVYMDDDLPGGRWVAAAVWVSDEDALVDLEQEKLNIGGGS